MIAQNNTIYHARLRMAHYYARRIKQFNSMYLSGDEGYAFQQFRDESEQIEQTLEWLTTHATDHEDTAHAFSAMLLNGHDLLSAYFSVRKHLALFKQLSQLVEAESDTATMLVCLLEIGFAYDMLNEHPLAMVTHKRRIALARQIGDYEALLLSRRFVALAYSETGQKHKAERWVLDSLEQSRQLKFAEEEVWCLLYLTLFMIDNGDWEQADHYISSAHAVVTQIRHVNPEQLLSVHKFLGVLKNDSGDPAASIPHLEKALSIAHATGRHTRIVEAMNAIAISYDNLGDFERAHHCYTQALTLAEQTNNRRWRAYLLHDMGNSYYLQAKYETACDHLEEAISLLLEASNEYWACFAMTKLVFTYTALDMPEKAHHCLHKCTLMLPRLQSDRLYALVITAAVKFLAHTGSKLDMIYIATRWAGFVYHMPQADNDAMVEISKIRTNLESVLGAEQVKQLMTEGQMLTKEDITNHILNRL